MVGTILVASISITSQRPFRVLRCAEPAIVARDRAIFRRVSFRRIPPKPGDNPISEVFIDGHRTGVVVPRGVRLRVVRTFGKRDFVGVFSYLVSGAYTLGVTEFVEVRGARIKSTEPESETSRTYFADGSYLWVDYDQMPVRDKDETYPKVSVVRSTGEVEHIAPSEGACANDRGDIAGWAAFDDHGRSVFPEWRGGHVRIEAFLVADRRRRPIGAFMPIAINSRGTVLGIWKRDETGVLWRSGTTIDISHKALSDLKLGDDDVVGGISDNGAVSVWCDGWFDLPLRTRDDGDDKILKDLDGRLKIMDTAGRWWTVARRA